MLVPSAIAQWSTNLWPVTNGQWIRAGHVTELHAAIDERTFGALDATWTGRVTTARWIRKQYVENAHDQLETLAPYYVNTNKLGTGTTFNAYFATNSDWIAWAWTDLVSHVTGTNHIAGMTSGGAVDGWWIKRETFDDLKAAADQLTHGWTTVGWGEGNDQVRIQYNPATPFSDTNYTNLIATSRAHYTNAAGPPTWLSLETNILAGLIGDGYWSMPVVPGGDNPGTVGQHVHVSHSTNGGGTFSSPAALNAWGVPVASVPDTYECDADLYVWAVAAAETPGVSDIYDVWSSEVLDDGTNTWPTSWTYTQTFTKVVSNETLDFTGTFGDTNHPYPLGLWPASNAVPTNVTDYGWGWNLRGAAILRWDSDATNGFLYLP